MNNQERLATLTPAAAAQELCFILRYAGYTNAPHYIEKWLKSSDRKPDIKVDDDGKIHAFWKYGENGGYFCTNCNTIFDDYYGASPESYPYCYSCGARMDLKEEVQDNG